MVRANKLESCYVRPIAFYGSEKMGVSPKGAQVHVAIAAWPWGAYLGDEGLEKGIRVKTSSFARHHVNVTMCRAKFSGTYANSILANQEALEHGYDEALLLDVDGFVAEGAGREPVHRQERRALRARTHLRADRHHARRGASSSPATSGWKSKAKRITRDDVYIADEAFFTGTAAEVTPIRELDNRVIGAGQARSGHREAAVDVLRRRQRPQSESTPLADPVDEPKTHGRRQAREHSNGTSRSRRRICRCTARCPRRCCGTRIRACSCRSRRPARRCARTAARAIRSRAAPARGTH